MKKINYFGSYKDQSLCFLFNFCIFINLLNFIKKKKKHFKTKEKSE